MTGCANDLKDMTGDDRRERAIVRLRKKSEFRAHLLAFFVVNGAVVIACGGGGAPIYDDPRLGWEGLDAVIDKDLAAAVLARDLGADLLLILTDVDAVYADWGTPQQRPLPRLTIEEAVQMDREGAFGEGSMAPKIRAAVDFARRTGGRAIITALEKGRDAVRGDAGTMITTTVQSTEHV